jgi:hypothetical protein
MKVRASERVGQSQLPFKLAIDPANATIVGLDSRGIVQITPPTQCWS